MNRPDFSVSPDNLEILAPAGSPEALIAAIRGGADAVYLGGGSFNARGNAHNFDAAALREAAALCHSRGVRMYLTLNTLIHEDELNPAMSLVGQACELGLDAIIVQDLGLAAAIRATAPRMPLHASTQLSCHTPSGVRELRDMGFSRIVLAREMSRNEIAKCSGQGAELEVFVHGALCMSVSGQCYLSAMLGGRSGNRGLCAQPCRLPFTVKQGKIPSDERALSLRDLSLYEYVADLASIGVGSLKIEGRMKRPEYVAAAARCFSKARDALTGNHKGADPELLRDLQSVFSRSGFTSGYYTGRRNSEMFGSRTYKDVTAAAPALARLAKLYGKETPRVPVTFTFTMHVGEPTTLTAEDGDGNRVTVTGELPQKAIKLPLDEQRIAAQLAKTGGTPFIASVTCNLQQGLTLPLSSLNALRRNALDKLLDIRAKATPIAFNPESKPEKPEANPKNKMHIIVRFSNVNQISENIAADMIVLPLNTPGKRLSELSEKYTVGVEIPRGLFGTEQQTARMLADLANVGVTTALCGNIAAIPLARSAGLSAIAGFGMNITNLGALEALIQRGIKAAVLSQELTFKQMGFSKDAPVPCGIIAYGHQPLMLLRNCPGKAAEECKSCSGGLTDRRGIRFPLTCAAGCAELLNSVPLWLADKLDRLPPLDFLLLHFTDETPEKVAAVLSAYQNGGKPPKDFTRGLYKRGVE